MKNLFEVSAIKTRDMEIAYIREPKTSTVKNGDGSESIIKSYVLELRNVAVPGRMSVGKPVVISVFATQNDDGEYRSGTFTELVRQLDNDVDAMLGTIISVDTVDVHFNTAYYWMTKDSKTNKLVRHMNPDGKTPSVVQDISFSRLDGDNTSFAKMIDKRILRIMAEKTASGGLGGFQETVSIGADKEYYIGEMKVTNKPSIEADDEIEEDKLD
jgi:hypothetical protein